MKVINVHAKAKTRTNIKHSSQTTTKPKSLHQQLTNNARQAGGAHKTVDNRQKMIKRFGLYLKDSNIQIHNIDQIKVSYIERYIQTRLNQGISKRTLHNEMSAIRQTLRAAGREKLADHPRISSPSLGISGASRKGTKVAISQEQYQAIHEEALQKSPALAATLDIAVTLGLRGEEAVQSCQSMKTWQKALQTGHTKIQVVFGTKGGRPRDVHIINPQQALHVINNALTIMAQQNGKLIDKPNLKQAMNYWRNSTYRLGLTGQISPHSLRYAFTQEQVDQYLQQGYSEQEALAKASMDLGHGDGRGRFIKLVYGGV
ncbi:integrase domain-containing protein [Orbus sturtevantii]|uniref:integrase domain-containing protein n=1 Tax=Orbus sturtevantii TaxID=3074109 RepID=UPI00370D413D